MRWLDMLFEWHARWTYPQRLFPPDTPQPLVDDNGRLEATRLAREHEMEEIRRLMAEDRQRLMRLQAEADLTQVTHRHRRKND